MSAEATVRYVGFEAKLLVREYSFIVQRPSNEVSKFTLTIGHEAFGPRGLRFQEAPDICALRLRREFAAFGDYPPETHFDISATDLADYRSTHGAKGSGLANRPAIKRG